MPPWSHLPSSGTWLSSVSSATSQAPKLSCSVAFLFAPQSHLYFFLHPRGSIYCLLLSVSCHHSFHDGGESRSINEHLEQVHYLGIHDCGPKQGVQLSYSYVIYILPCTAWNCDAGLPWCIPPASHSSTCADYIPDLTETFNVLTSVLAHFFFRAFATSLSPPPAQLSTCCLAYSSPRNSPPLGSWPIRTVLATPGLNLKKRCYPLGVLLAIGDCCGNAGLLMGCWISVSMPVGRYFSILFSNYYWFNCPTWTTLP